MRRPATTTDYRMNWGPYADRGEATVCLSRFTNATLGTDLGIVYCDINAATLLRRPNYDANGKGYTLIANWLGPVIPPRLQPPSEGFLGRVEHFFENILADYGREQIKQSEMQLSYGRAIDQSLAQWMSNPTHEHEIGLAVDILGVVSFALLFVPGVGEAEMGVWAVARTAMAAGDYLKVAGLGTSSLAFIGSVCGLGSDGGYMYYRYIDPSGGKTQAEAWGDKKWVKILSTASAVMVIPDLAVGSIIMYRDLPKIVEEANEAISKSQDFAARSEKLAKKSNKIDEISDGGQDRILAERMKRVSEYAKERAKTLTDHSVKLNDDARKLYKKLYTTMAVNGTASFVGTPMTEFYFAHDNRTDINMDFRKTKQWPGQYLMPSRPVDTKNYESTQNLCFHIGATCRPPR